MKTNATIRYIGPALDDGRMDVYQASLNMIAFSEFMVAAVKSTFGDNAEARAEVSGFAHGSFSTNIVFELVGASATIFTAYTPDHLWATVKGAFTLWKHLKGSKPAGVVNHGQYVSITNNSGEIIQIKTESLNLVFNEKSAESAQRFIKQALDKEGYEKLEISNQEIGMIDSVTKAESDGFIPINVEQVASDYTNRMNVVILAAVFQDGNKWRFNDGAAPFSATILDNEFIARVGAGERFGKGDLLDVDLRTIQTRSGLKITSERSVLKVHDHIVPPEQVKLI